MENQIKLLEKYGITDYTIKNGVITVHQIIHLDCKTIEKEFLAGAVLKETLLLNSLEKVHKDFLKGTTLKDLRLGAIKKVPKGFLSETKISHILFLKSLEVAPEDFLKGITITDCFLPALKKAPKGLLEGATIKYYTVLDSLEEAEENFLENTLLGVIKIPSGFNPPKGFLRNAVFNNPQTLHFLAKLNNCEDFISQITMPIGFLSDNVLKNNSNLASHKELVSGYNKDQSYCYFDRILSRVSSVAKKKNYTIYSITDDSFIAQKGEFTAHGETVKKAIQDLEFKIISEKLKKDPINKDTEFTVKYYRALTGACDSGCRDWMAKNKIKFRIEGEDTVELKPIKAEELLPLLEKTNAYGIEKFKSLITF